MKFRIVFLPFFYQLYNLLIKRGDELDIIIYKERNFFFFLILKKKIAFICKNYYFNVSVSDLHTQYIAAQNLKILQLCLPFFFPPINRFAMPSILKRIAIATIHVKINLNK